MNFLRDVSLALGQMGDARFRKVLGLGIGLTLLLFAAFYVGVVWLVGWWAPETITLPLIGEIDFFKKIAEGGSLIIAVILSVFLMIPVASAFTGMFLDQVADAVEDVHYPHLPDADGLPLMATIVDSLQFLGLLILANILGLFIWLILLVIMPPLAPLTFYALNGFLLGREYFQLVAVRRHSLPKAKALRRANRGSIWLLGIVMAVPLTIPFLNLLVPIIGAASFTHLYHRLVRD